MKLGTVLVESWSRAGEGAQVREQQEGSHDRVAALAREIKELARRRHRHVVTTARLSQLTNRLPLLTELLAHDTKDHRRRADVIDEAVVAAVARLSAGAGSAGAEVDRYDLMQMERLFGLTPEMRRLHWGKRQQAAADVRHQAVETFRKEPQERLLYLVAMQLSGNHHAPSTSFGSMSGEFDLTVFAGQQALRPWLTRYIHETRPREARLVLNSGVASTQILGALRDVDAEITLIICHPNAAITAWQRDRIKTSVKEMRQYDFAGYEKLRLYFFPVPPSIRGWRVGNYVGMSWYVYRDDLRLAVGHPEQITLSGHDSIVVVGNVATPSGARLAAWFEQEADNLMRHRLTIDEHQYNEAMDD